MGGWADGRMGGCVDVWVDWKGGYRRNALVKGGGTKAVWKQRRPKGMSILARDTSVPFRWDECLDGWDEGECIRMKQRRKEGRERKKKTRSEKASKEMAKRTTSKGTMAKQKKMASGKTKKDNRKRTKVSAEEWGVVCGVFLLCNPMEGVKAESEREKKRSKKQKQKKNGRGGWMDVCVCVCVVLSCDVHVGWVGLERVCAFLSVDE